MVQQRRNAIHAFKAKTIGTTDELHAALAKFLEFVEHRGFYLIFTGA